jgi:lipopolysaccharide biosynthesis regulator YciM
MFRTAEIATALTAAWVRNGASKTPKEVADFYCDLCGALEQAQSNNISKAKESRGKISKADSR